MANRPLVSATSAQPPRDDVLPPRRPAERGTHKAELYPIGGLRSELLFEQYGILENPFGVTPDPRYLYQSRSHAEARASLIIGIECRVGFQTLIAPPGMGKTTILFNLLEQFNNVARTAFLFQTHGDSRDFLRSLISELEDEARDSDLVGMQDTINHLLIREHRAGRQTIVIIDEAQSLNTTVLETLRLLSNFETHTQKLLQIILAGQPQLAQRLATPEAAQLYQRISIRTTLIPFDLEDTRNYIEHRLRVAGYQGPPLFTPAALKLIWERSGGVPREINTLCFNAVLLAKAVEQKQVDSDILQEVLADLDLDRILSKNDTPASPMEGAQAARRLRTRTAPLDLRSTPARVDNSRDAAVPDIKAEVNEASTMPTFGDVEPAHLGTIVPEKVPTGNEQVKSGVAPATRTEGSDVAPSAASSRATQEVVSVPGVNGAATGLCFDRFSLASAGLIIGLVSLLIIHSLISIVGSPGKRNFERSSVWRTEQFRKSGTTGISKQIHDPTDKRGLTPLPLQQPTEVVQSPSIPIGTLQEDRQRGSRIHQTDASSGTSQSFNIVPVRLVHEIKPVYPSAAIEAGIQGEIVLSVLVSQEGAVRDVRFLSGPPVLAQAAIDAVKQWQFQPSYLRRQPMEWETQVTLKFTLP